MTVLGIIGIIAAFCLLMYMIMKGFNIYLTVFVCTLVVALTSQMNVYEAYKVHFMTGFTNFFKNYYLVFLTGTLMAKAMDITGGAKAIAKAIITTLDEMIAGGKPSNQTFDTKLIERQTT